MANGKLGNGEQAGCLFYGKLGIVGCILIKNYIQDKFMAMTTIDAEKISFLQARQLLNFQQQKRRSLKNKRDRLVQVTHFLVLQ